MARPVSGGGWRRLFAAIPSRTVLLAAALLALSLAVSPTAGAVPADPEPIAVDDRAQTPPASTELRRVSDQAKPPASEPAAPTAPAAGQLAADFALQFVGYPYAWAGNTPAGFDCSGFTQYVILNTLGVDIGHAVEGQPAGGAFVEWGAWLPGDVVFFQNTYRAGISHAGLYLGDGLFVHAENEGTGVVVTSIYSDYYGSRYWGAVRVG